MGMFSGIQSAKESAGGAYLKPGVYRLKVLACKAVKKFNGVNGFAAEFEVLESTCADLLPGSFCSWVAMLNQEPALGNIKAFITAAAACEESQVTEEAMEIIVGPQNPLKGHEVRASAHNILTKKGGDFTKVKWLPGADTSALAAEPAA
jgi:hypothetical protein